MATRRPSRTPARRPSRNPPRTATSTTPGAMGSSSGAGGNAPAPSGPPVDPLLDYDNGAHIGPAAQMTAAGIDPVERVSAPTIGGVTVANPAQMAAAIRLARGGEAPYSSSRLALMRSLEDQANGVGPSLAETTLRGASDRLNAQERGRVLAMRGASPGLALRASMTRSGDLSQQLAQQIAEARLKERLDAQNALSSVQSQGQTFEQQAAAADAAAQNRQLEVQAGLNQQTVLSNQAAANQRQVEQAELQTRSDMSNQLAANTRATNVAQLNQQAAASNQAATNARATNQAQINAGVQNQQTQSAAQVGAAQASAAGNVGAAQASAYGAITSAGLYSNASILNNTLDNATTLSLGQGSLSGQGATAGANATNQNNQINANLVGSAANGAGGGLASDERLKKNIIPADDKIEAWLNDLKAKNFEYKQSKFGAGKTTGVMAQDMEKSEVGREMVQETPEGKIIDFKKGLSALFAAQANIHKRLQELEGKKAA